ncbi:MAG: nuclear transport factor 2 family protein [Reichenbachiella sp.]
MTQVQLIEKFYSSFKSKDAEGMISCYHKELQFKDPVFGPLDYDKASAMWKMLLRSGKDLEIYFHDVQDDCVKWEAQYSFSKTGRKVHNRISAQFEFKDSLIVSHVDSFDLYKWARMAFGPTGWLIGWTPFFVNKLRKTVQRQLAKELLPSE